jgi:hypothetical protein
MDLPMAAERGQAQLELIAGAPFLLLAGLVTLQLLAAGYSQSLADGAAEAGAIAVADGRDPLAAARAALPGWAGEDVAVDVDAGHVEVEVRPPAVLPLPGGPSAISSSAWARPAAEPGPP